MKIPKKWQIPLKHKFRLYILCTYIKKYSLIKCSELILNPMPMPPLLDGQDIEKYQRSSTEAAADRQAFQKESKKLIQTSKVKYLITNYSYFQTEPTSFNSSVVISQLILTFYFWCFPFEFLCF